MSDGVRSRCDIAMDIVFELFNVADGLFHDGRMDDARTVNGIAKQTISLAKKFLAEDGK